MTWVTCPAAHVSGHPSGLSLGWTLGGKSHLPTALEGSGSATAAEAEQGAEGLGHR